jgi:transcriptional regulator with XRE-family HTH domain
MNDRERAICSRVREFRRAVRWSQQDFAPMVGLSRHQLANIEHERTPLRYEIGWWISTLFERGLEWFLGYASPPDGLSVLPTPRRTGLPKTALLSEVFDRFCGPASEHQTPQHQKGKTPQIKIGDDELRNRMFVLMRLKADLESWISRLPTGYIEGFCDEIIRLSDTYLKGTPEDSAELIDARYRALVLEQKYASMADRITGAKKDQFSGLTEAETCLKPVDVKAQLPSLLERLNRATKETGKMSALADFLGKAVGHRVPLASVSRWLAGKREPGGEITLKLLRWVEQQERQK